MNTEKLQKQIEQTRERLTLYIEQEKKILQGGVQAYGIGSRSLTRYNTDLSAVRAAIDELQAKLDELENLLDCGSCRRSLRVVLKDN